MVEIDDLEKRITWLDSERQKDKKYINDLQDSLEALQGIVQRQKADLKKVELVMKAVSPLPARIDTVGEEVASTKTEILKKVIDLEKTVIAGDKKNAVSSKEGSDLLSNRISDLQSELKPISDLKKAVQSRVEEEFRINQKIENLANEIPSLHTSDEETQRQIVLLSGERNQETKRIIDLQLENAALKKRIEEIRNSYDLDKDALRKVDKKIDDLLATEKERKQTQIAYLEKNSLDMLEKNTQWNTWQQKMDELQSLGQSISEKQLEFAESNRAVKRTQSEFEEVNERINRRINEITEMNRLTEDRFRSEWVAFKADDQKRWTNYTLTREEESREGMRSLTQITERLVNIEDSIQDIQDTVRLLSDETQKMINGFYSATQEMLESFSQTFKKR